MPSHPATLIAMERSHFERLVVEAYRLIPQELLAYLENVDVVVDDGPSWDQLAGHQIEEGEILLGLYEGVPLTDRDEYGMVLPDKITLFQDSIESICSDRDEVIEQIRLTVVHEVAHHFGIDDDRLHELGVG